MEMTLTLRSEIERGIAGLGMNFSEFGEWSGINRGIFSAILNSNPPKPISLNQFERITKALGHPEGWMFEQYIDECFYDGKPNRRRVEPFLIRCAEMGRLDCIEIVLSRLLEDLKQLDTIFEIAEALYTADKVEQSVVFYECIVQNEKYHQSERLAISQYRLFRAALGEDNERNLRAAIEFEPFCDKLPDHHRLDGLMKLVNVYFSLDKRIEAARYSREMIVFTEILYQAEVIKNAKSINLKELYSDYPLVVYYGYAHLAMQKVMIDEGDYIKAEQYIEMYKDLSWFPGLDDNGRREVEKFKFYAEANVLTIELLKGNENILPTCITFIEKNPAELLKFIFTILESSNKYGFNTDIIFEKFSEQLHQYLEQKYHYDRMTILNDYCSVCLEASLYFLKRQNHIKAIDYILRGLVVAVKINDKEMFMKCVPLFEKNRDLASPKQTLEYVQIMEGI
ncbi:DNA-binding protein [Saccharibacillus sp. CPCC 101409]|uniref:DNA-binding protein n=1 Tax=Saccharibacillus sp. CPCC 101409 TaxID=3058041 RepID=UPI002671C851|nr:DNA-binding protein [Saccharibacillus sp. CPCC 101409]MDO3409469.1 DNA-binding protein [Saccharibacillus sp. CPCC 101409]